MLNIFICEDNEKQRSDLNEIIKDILNIEKYEMQIMVSTHDPEEILNYVKDNKGMGIYFLDLNLNNEINGFELAKQIRKYDKIGFIVFVTSYTDATQLTFTYQLEAMDCIDKNGIQGMTRSIKNCLTEINNRIFVKNYQSTKHLIMKNNDRIIKIDLSQIIYIETTKKNYILIHCESSEVEIPGSINKIECSLDDRFYKCDRYCLINRKKVKEIDDENKIIYFINGDNYAILTKKNKKVFMDRLSFFQK